MPIETDRLLIRPFMPTDLTPVHSILDRAFGDGSGVNDAAALAERKSWLDWSRLSQTWFPKLHQPPYGERAVVLKRTDTLIGVVGLVPCLDRFDQISELANGEESTGLCTAEVGLFWAIDPDHQRNGYATEAAEGMIAYAFNHLHLKRIIATTKYDNHASQAVMRKLNMSITRNPLPTPAWLQIVGILHHSSNSV